MTDLGVTDAEHASLTIQISNLRDKTDMMASQPELTEENIDDMIGEAMSSLDSLNDFADRFETLDRQMTCLRFNN